MIRYAEMDHTLVLRFSEDVRYTECGSLNVLLDEVFAKRNVNNVLIDLTHATGIDSTGLGLLARINNHIQAHFHHKTPIFSTNPDIDRTLDNMGFDEIFIILHQDPAVPVDHQELPEHATTDRETAEMLLEAHKNLASLNDKNWREFDAVISALEADLHITEPSKPRH